MSQLEMLRPMFKTAALEDQPTAVLATALQEAWLAHSGHVAELRALDLAPIAGLTDDQVRARPTKPVLEQLIARDLAEVAVLSAAHKAALKRAGLAAARRQLPEAARELLGLGDQLEHARVAARQREAVLKQLIDSVMRDFRLLADAEDWGAVDASDLTAAEAAVRHAMRLVGDPRAAEFQAPRPAGPREGDRRTLSHVGEPNVRQVFSGGAWARDTSSANIVLAHDR